MKYSRCEMLKPSGGIISASAVKPSISFAAQGRAVTRDLVAEPQRNPL